MKVQQISVFLENKAGRLASVALILKNSGINIRALTIADSRDFGILRLIVDKPDDAVNVLKDAGFMVKQNLMLAVQIDDSPGLFYDIVELCDKEGINVEYLYSFVNQISKKAILFLKVENIEAASELFAKKGYTLVSFEDACNI